MNRSPSLADRGGRVRRFLLALAFCIAFGGFTFYAGVVVPIGADVLDATSQGFVTRRVTRVINVAHVVLAAALYWEARATLDRRRRRRLTAITIGIALCTAALLTLHGWLDQLLNAETHEVADSDQFYRRHQAYLWVSTVQWTLSIAALWLLSDRRDASEQ